MYTKLYAISGMSCENCAARVQETLESLSDVAGVQILLESAQAVVRTRERISIETINAALNKAGHYRALETNEAAATPRKPKPTPSFFRFFDRKKSCCE